MELLDRNLDADFGHAEDIVADQDRRAPSLIRLGAFDGCDADTG
jgi:hypothetical protein